VQTARRRVEVHKRRDQLFCTRQIHSSADNRIRSISSLSTTLLERCGLKDFDIISDSVGDPEQKEIRIHNERSQQQKSNDNSKNFLVNCVFIFAYDNNCLYWIENKLFLFYLIIYPDPKPDPHLFGLSDPLVRGMDPVIRILPFSH
jgi:hypothetical protein